MAEYHSNDFDFDGWARQAKETLTLPSIVLGENEIEFSDKWDNFFSCHNSGNFFKPRRYLALEFAKYFNATHVKTVLEVGCGHGCSMYPLLESCPSIRYIATDYSVQALEILKSHKNFDASRVLAVEHWDVTERPSQKLIDLKPDVVLAVFALSAIVPEQHEQSFRNMIELFRFSENSSHSKNTNTQSISGDSISIENSSYGNNKPVILFRDYAIHDMTMYRHTIRHSEHLYRRSDNTLAYYFDLEYVRNICETVGLDVLELEYATIEIKNRKNNNTMRRVFIHGVFQLR